MQGNGATVPKAFIQHDAPALSCHWSKDGTKLASASADKTVKMMDLNTGQTTQVAAHDGPIKCVKWVDGAGGMQYCLATGSWDKTLKVRISLFKLSGADLIVLGSEIAESDCNGPITRTLLHHGCDISAHDSWNG